MLKQNVIRLSDSVSIVQTFETDSDGNVIAEYHSLRLTNDAARVVQTVSFVDEEFSAEDLRTAADLLENFRMQSFADEILDN